MAGLMLKARLGRIERRLGGLEGRKRFRIVYADGSLACECERGGAARRAVFIMPRPGPPIEKTNAGGPNSHGGEK